MSDTEKSQVQRSAVPRFVKYVILVVQNVVEGGADEPPNLRVRKRQISSALMIVQTHVPQRTTCRWLP